MTAFLIAAAIGGWLVALWAIHHANRWHDTCLREREQRTAFGTVHTTGTIYVPTDDVETPSPRPGRNYR